MMNTLIARSMKQCSNKFYDAFHEPIRDMIHKGYLRNILHNPRLVMYKMMGTTINGITITKGTEKKISGVINVMKYRGLIENRWTIDITREVYSYGSFKDKAEVLKAAANSFYLDRWKSQPRKLLLMCEAKGYVGVIKNIADEFRVPYVAAGGDMSVQIKMEIAKSLDDPTTILYYGDYDPKGIQIPDTIEHDIRAINPDADFEMSRMFINRSDIGLYGLDRDSDGNVQMEQLDADIAIRESIAHIEGMIDIVCDG